MIKLCPLYEYEEFDYRLWDSKRKIIRSKDVIFREDVVEIDGDQLTKIKNDTITNFVIPLLYLYIILPQVKNNKWKVKRLLSKGEQLDPQEVEEQEQPQL